MKNALLLFSCFAYTHFTLISSATHDQQKIIVINGSSSAGKTSIIKQMQQMYKSPLLTIGIDLLWEIMPPQYANTGTKAEEGFLFLETYDDQKRPVITIKLGQCAQQLCQQLPDLIKSLALTGYDIIVDEAFINETISHCYAKILKDYNAYFIGVFCDLAELERREKSRGDREIGLARGQVNNAQKYTSCYDFTIDTTNTSTHECVRQIITYVENNPKPVGFQKLYAQIK